MSFFKEAEAGCAAVDTGAVCCGWGWLAAAVTGPMTDMLMEFLLSGLSTRRAEMLRILR